MRIHFWGAAQTVTGSMHLVEANNRRLLLDVGLYQGRRKEAFERNRNLPFDARSIDAVILSHAHIDHVGNLPNLVKSGFKGKVYATPATRDLAGLMLMDSARIQESDVARVNRQRGHDRRKLFEPLYTERDAVAALKRFVSVDYEESFEPLPGFSAFFRDAGHMLGSASVAVDVTEERQTSRLVFSGDIGRHGLPILRDPKPIEGARFVIMESTYGNRLHESIDDAKEQLRQTIADAVAAGGKLLIPAFAVGRTQEIVFRINQLISENKLPNVDMFVDSPLAANVTEVFRMHPECFDDEMRIALLNEKDGDVFGFRRLTYIRDVEESKQLNRRTGPAVIIAASGMCEAGRILHHLRNHLADHRAIVLFVGYQAEHTLGRKLLDGESPVSVFGEEIAPRAKIRRADSYSSHADRNELLAWMQQTQQTGKVEACFLVHGEQPALNALQSGLREQGVPKVQAPARGDVVDLG